MKSFFYEQIKHIYKNYLSNNIALRVFLGAGSALFVVGILHIISLESMDIPVLMAPFGASVTLVFGLPKSPFSKPRNVIFGHLLSSVIGITCYKIFGDFWLASMCLSVPLAIMVMFFTNNMHPPAGGTALVTAIGDIGVQKIGYLYAISPALIGSCVIVLFGYLVNNLLGDEKYP